MPESTVNPVISLLTDFGVVDPYVGVMKGVILNICPAARIVDLTHDVPPQDIVSAGYLLESSWRFFPPGTVHVAVVDPGVGSDRRILAASFLGHFFIAPDNGLLPIALGSSCPDEMVLVENRDFSLKEVSQTFHGRDIFAPVAAHLANGLELSALGSPCANWVNAELPRPERGSSGEIEGEVIYIDRFGNLVTNISEAELSGECNVEVEGRTIHGLVLSYAAAAQGELLAIIGSTGRLEISVNQGDAREELAAVRGTRVRVLPPGS